jgi:hypothetical protein
MKATSLVVVACVHIDLGMQQSNVTEAVRTLDAYPLIGISGKLGSGKTTLAHYITNAGTRPYEIHAFADRLRYVLALLTNTPVEKTRSTEDKNRLLPSWGKTIGTMLQDIGSGIRNAVNTDAWVISLFDYWVEDTSRWVVHDVRYPNEADAIRQRGGLLIRLYGDPGQTVAQSTRDLNHASETALDDYPHFDVIINTDAYAGRMDALYEEIARQLRARDAK